MPTTPSLDLFCLGNAIVDVIAPCEDRFLADHGIIKGAMNLIDAERAELLYAAMGPATETSGGSAGNTAAGAAALGARAAFSGKVADDQLGAIYRHDIDALNVAFDTASLSGPPPTARSMIFVTPDAQRSMNTYLGACVELGPDDVEPEKAAGAAITYFEGYLWDPPAAKALIRDTARIAHENGRQVAMTLSDAFCVDRYRDEFLNLIRSKTVDIVFGNADEVRSLYEVDDLTEATERLGQDASVAVVTHGAEGSMTIRGARRASVEAWPVAKPVDTTGAGDLYAAGFLTALARGASLEACCRLGSFAAACIIEQIGPRPQATLGGEALAAGLL